MWIHLKKRYNMLPSDSEKIAGCHEVTGASARKAQACPFVWLHSSGNRKLQAMERTSCGSKQGKRLRGCRWEETPRSPLDVLHDFKRNSKFATGRGG